MSLTRIGSIGINTGIAFAGVTTIVTLNTANDALSIGATVNVGSGITLGASGDIFATGVSTFSGNLKVGSGVTISPDGDGFFTGVITATSYSGIDLSAVTGATGDFSIADKIVHTGDTNTAIRFPAADTITAETAGSERLRITSAGNLALGNDGSFPIYTETNDRNFILGTGSDDAAIQLHSGTDKFGGLYFGDATSGGDRYVGYVEYKHDDNYLRISTGGSERLRIDSSGRLMLGSPTEGNSSADDLTVATSSDTGITIRSGTSSGGNIYFSDGTSGADEYRGVVSYDHASNFMQFYTNASEALRIDSSGRVLVGRTASRMVGGSTTYAKLQVAGTSQSESSISLVNNEASAAAPFIFFGKTRGNSVGESGIVQNGDSLGGLSFIGADGNDINNRTAEITAVVNGTPANNTIPTDIVFSTSTQNATQLAEVLRLDKNGHARFGASGDANDAAWSHGTYNNTEVAIDGGGGYAVLHMRGDGAGSTNTRWSMGVGDDKFYMAYDDVDGAHRMVVNGEGVVSIPVGIELGSGVDGSPTGNILDEYEEGTFTPSIAAGRTGSITYQNQTGFYTKIGNTVFLRFYMQMSGGSTNGSVFYIGGLPFTNINQTAYEGGGYHTYQNSFFDSGDPRDNHPWLALNSSQVNFHKTSNGGAVTGNETTTNQHYLIFHLQHIVA